MRQMNAAESIVDKVVNEALQEFTSELNKAAAQAEETLLEYERQAASEVSKIFDATARQEDILRRKILGSAELAARNQQLQLIEDSVNKVFEEALNRLSKLSREKTEKALRQLINEALEAIEGNITILCRKEDYELVKKLASELSKNTNRSITVSKNHITSKGGVQAVSEDSTTIYDNTYEARLARIRQLLRKEVVKTLTSGE
ncbi:MAG: V-type ATP synthase subunit E family protein [Nitrososphaerales archaeon]